MPFLRVPMRAMALACCVCLACAAEPDRELDAEAFAAVAPAIPGRAPPASPAPAAWFTLHWDGNTTTVAIAAPGPGTMLVGARRPAWVVTATAKGEAQVWYRATAFLDAQGGLHIDGTGADVGGPAAQSDGGGWIPDSFLIAGDRAYIRDDQPRHQGYIVAAPELRLQALDPDGHAAAMARVRGWVEGE